MPPRKSNVSIVSNGAEDGGEATPAKAAKEKEGLSIDELSLPKSMVARLAKGVLPANTQIQKDALLALHKSATVFVSYLASNSSENAQAAGKRTIQPLDVMAALKDAEFDDFLPRLEAELKKYNDTQCDKRNTYRRKIKEEKATTGGSEVGEPNATGKDGRTTNDSNTIMNGHVNGDSAFEQTERPMKKLKADTGIAVTPEGDDVEDEDVNGDGEVESEADEEDEEVEDEEDDEEGDDENEDPEEDEDAHSEMEENGVSHPYSHDETLDENDSD